MSIQVWFEGMVIWAWLGQEVMVDANERSATASDVGRGRLLTFTVVSMGSHVALH